MKYLLALTLVAISARGCCQDCEKKQITCKLTSPEMQKRKTTVIASLKTKILEKTEQEEGYTYKFVGSDAVVDELSSFIKTERLCCDFFDFTLKVKGDGSIAWLTISGPKGAKEF